MHCFNYFDLNQPNNPISLGLGYLFALMVISIISGDKYLQNIAFQWLHSTHFWVKDIIAIIIIFMVVIFIIFIFMTTYWWPSLSSGSPLKFLIIRTHDGDNDDDDWYKNIAMQCTCALWPTIQFSNLLPSSLPLLPWWSHHLLLNHHHCWKKHSYFQNVRRRAGEINKSLRKFTK